MSVVMMPGATALTVTPEAASSRAAVLASPSSPAFEALYDARMRSPISAASEEM